MWGIVWDKADGSKMWLDKNDKSWWVDKPYFPYIDFEAAKYEASPFVNVRIIDEKDWWILPKSSVKTGIDSQNNSVYSFFATCTAPNCCAKCSAPIPCKYHT